MLFDLLVNCKNSCCAQTVSSVFKGVSCRLCRLFVCLFIYLFICFLGPLSQHMEVFRLEVKTELQLPADTTATAMQDPS